MEDPRLFGSLPTHLAERVRPLNGRAASSDGEFVLLWLHHAVRGHENAVLDVAVDLANRLDHPVLIYQGLGGDHRFNSDRHHTFILEGARDLDGQLRERTNGCIRFAFHLPEDRSSPSPLRELVRRASVCVVEDFPAPPFPKWSMSLARRAPCAVIAVDATCVVPMQSLTKAYDRAYKFRSKAWKDYLSRLREPWPEAILQTRRTLEGADLGFEPVDFETLDIANACARCRIDHSVPPVADTVGGSRAGYERWERFWGDRLGAYHKARNSAAQPEAVSRMSAYLHHGHVSALRLGREALERGGDGADKFLDELFVWREMAHNFCFYRTLDDPSGASLETSAALPDWAVQTLRDHRSDEREHRYTWEQLAIGATHSGLWNACQRSLFRQGELHNNVRMTWGKAILEWTRSPGIALDTLIDLNHRYSLDGNDPNSYGGLLWCMGQFDRPFEPEQAVLGTVRPRDVDSHEQRVDMKRYDAWTSRPERSGRQRIAVVGAGPAGAMAARTLARHGHRVTVFEKSRGPGGRTATRYAGEQRFDHGAPSFRTDDPRLARWIKSWLQHGILAEWPEGSDRYVPTPGANALAAHLCSSLDDIRFGARVTGLSRPDDGQGGWVVGWTSDDGERRDRFDSVVFAIPSVQASILLRDPAPELAGQVDRASFAPRWSVMIETDRVELEAPVVESPSADELESIILNSSKPGRPAIDGRSAFVAHATTDFSREHLERDIDEIAQVLGRAFESSMRNLKRHAAVRSAVAHRWRYALATQRASETHEALADVAQRLYVCGDWVCETRREYGIQGALLSGMAAAGRLLGQPGPVHEGAPDGLFREAAS